MQIDWIIHILLYKAPYTYIDAIYMLKLSTIWYYEIKNVNDLIPLYSVRICVYNTLHRYYFIYIYKMFIGDRWIVFMNSTCHSILFFCHKAIVDTFAKTNNWNLQTARNTNSTLYLTYIIVGIKETRYRKLLPVFLFKPYG